MINRRTINPLAIAAAALALCLLAPAVGQAQSPIRDQPEDALRALVKLPAKGGGALAVTSPAFADGGAIPEASSQYGANQFPGLAWSPGPAAVKSYVLVLQDDNVVVRGQVLVHMTLINIPAGTTTLAPGMMAAPAGASYGASYLGAHQAYAGPKPPPGPVHHYHFQVFALDAALPPSAGDAFGALAAAMDGHVLASGEVVGTFKGPAGG